MAMGIRIWKPPEVVDRRSFARALMLDHISVDVAARKPQVWTIRGIASTVVVS
jgi:hypothetical protein